MSEQDLLHQLHLDQDAREPRGGQRWPWLLGVIAVVLALGLGAYRLTARQAVAVEVATAAPMVAGNTAVLDATGYVVARLQSTVSSKISGRLAEVLIEEGDRVESGQVLARLDDADAKAQLALAQARLTAARAELEQLEVQRDQARRTLDRQQALSVRKLTSQESLENARTQVDSLSAQIEVKTRQAQVEEAQLRVAQVNDDNTIVRAPFAGVVVTKAAQPGEIVSPMSAGGGFTRTGIGTIVDMDSLEIEVDVNESFINRVTPGQTVRAALDAYPDWPIPGAVIAIVPTADRSKATVKVRIAIHAKDPRLLPEMGARVSFLKESTEGAEPSAGGVLIPLDAILDGEGPARVLVLQGERVQERPVTLGETIGEQRLITQGLTAGEQVVRAPSTELRDGARVVPRGGS